MGGTGRAQNNRRVEVVKRFAKVLGCILGIIAVVLVVWSFCGAVDPMRAVPSNAGWVVRGTKLTWAWDRLGGEEGVKSMLRRGLGKDELPDWPGPRGRALDFLLPRLIGDCVVFYNDAPGREVLISRISPCLKLPIVLGLRFALEQEEGGAFRVGSEEQVQAYVALEGRCLMAAREKEHLLAAAERLIEPSGSPHAARSLWEPGEGSFQPNLELFYEENKDASPITETIFQLRIDETSQFRGRVGLRGTDWPRLGTVSTTQMELFQAFPSAGLLRWDVRGPVPLKDCFHALGEEPWAQRLAMSEVGRGCRGFQRNLGFSAQEDLFPLLGEECAFIFQGFACGPPVPLPSMSLGSQLGHPDGWEAFVQGLAEEIGVGSRGIFHLLMEEKENATQWVFHSEGTPSFRPTLVRSKDQVSLSTTKEALGDMENPGPHRIVLPQGQPMEGDFAFLFQAFPAELGDLLGEMLDAMVAYELFPGLNREAFDQQWSPVVRWLKLVELCHGIGVLEGQSVLFEGAFRLDLGEES